MVENTLRKSSSTTKLGCAFLSSETVASGTDVVSYSRKNTTASIENISQDTIKKSFIDEASKQQVKPMRKYPFKIIIDAKDFEDIEEE